MTTQVKSGRNRGGKQVPKVMSELRGSQKQVDSENKSSSGWLDWAERHPGTVALGILFVAAVLLAREPSELPREIDPVSEEVPLFI